MEVFVDFGLFEVLAAAGLAAVARRVYTRRWLGLGFLAVSLIAPVVLIFITGDELVRWIAVACLATTLVNVSLIFLLLRRWDMKTLLIKPQSSSPTFSDGASPTAVTPE